MSASAILSPVNAPLAAQASGALTGDASAPAGEFAAVLAVEASEAVTPTGQTNAAPSADPLPAGQPGEEDGVVEDGLAVASEVIVAPLWVQLAAVTAPNGASGTSDEASINGGGTQASANLMNEDGTKASANPVLQADADDATAVPGQTSLAGQATESEAAIAAEKARSAAQRPSSPAGDAALASLRALPGAAALQQATITQRKLDATSPDAKGADAEAAGTLESSLSSSFDGKIRNAAGLTATAGKALTDTGPAQASTQQDNASPAAERLTFLAASGAMNATGPVMASSAPGSETLPSFAEALLPSLDPDAPVLAGSATTSSSSLSTLPTIETTSLSSLSRATIETTAQLAAQITGRLSGQSTRFELGLTPEGLGRVDVTLDIDSDGQLSARLAFDNPLAATELRGRADDLRRQLEDAGFTVARDALEFSSRDSSSGHGTDQRQQRATAYADRHAARNELADLPPVWTLPSSNVTPRGVDVKV